MKMTEEGLALIRHFEGFRGTAYRDAVGVWTIGYGHTSMAGPPQVKPGQVMSRESAAHILVQDVEMFAKGVADAVLVLLSDAQFSALVSFAYNVGLGAFRKSSVLKAVNAGDVAAVSRRLNLWVKAGGRTLPGLVKRRAAEGGMFAEGAADAAEPIPAKPASAKRTIWSAVLTVALIILNRIRNLKKEGL